MMRKTFYKSTLVFLSLSVQFDIVDETLFYSLCRVMHVSHLRAGLMCTIDGGDIHQGGSLN